MNTQQAAEKPHHTNGRAPEVEVEHQPLLDKLEQFGHNVTDFVVQRPLSSVGLAVGVGFLFGRARRIW